MFARAFAAALLSLTLLGCASAGRRGRASYQAVVDARHTGAEGALVSGVPTFRTIGAALAAAPAAEGGEGRPQHVIYVRNGRYREKLSVSRPNVTLRGESRDGTVLTYDDAADTPKPGGAGGTLGTRGSYTIRVAAPDFHAESLTIENGFDFPANARKADGDPTKRRNTQAVAVLTDSASDRAVFENVRLSGYQDTLFANAGRHYFGRCVILGHVDFIFGAGQAVFEECDIVSRDRGDPLNNGYVAAPSTRDTQPYGFLFLRSRLLKESPALAKGSVALGRPWHPGGRPDAIGSAVFVDCWMDDHISARGWEPMSGFRAEDARFYEYGSRGPGAIASPTRRVLSAAESANYTPEKVLRGWRPLV
ncbi:MAG TPA: pectinesterase family protein [Gemmatimonadaceae bacterium]|nr:pectinesterase family protein [Gemmatimonadaceae bacterium]